MRHLLYTGLLLTLSCQTPPANESLGKTSLETLIIDGIPRTFVLHVPPGVDGSQDVPLVFMFHGSSGDGPKFFSISGWREKADAENFIAIFPSSLAYCFHFDENQDGDILDPGETKTTTKWNSGEIGNATFPLCADDVLQQIPPEKQEGIFNVLANDVAFVDAMIQSTLSTLPIDTNRVYAAGFSNGGGFVAKLIKDRAETFAAFHIAAGQLNEAPALLNEKVSAIVSLGTLDDNLVEALNVPELPFDASILDITADNFVFPILEMAGLSQNFELSQLTLEGKGVLQFNYRENLSNTGSEVSFIVIEDVEHQYPNGINHPVKIVDPVFEFFTAHAR